jgi:uncharacterized membrane protein YfhO
LAGAGEEMVFENPEANGAAWIPKEIIPAKSNQEEIELLEKLQTKTQATVNTAEFGVAKAGSGQIKLVSYGPNEMKYTAAMQESGLAVFSEIHYPKGWIATINGKETPILRVNYLLRGLNLPAGNQEIVFKFSPSSYTSTKTPMVIFQYLIVLALIFGLYITAKEKNGRV